MNKLIGSCVEYKMVFKRKISGRINANRNFIDFVYALNNSYKLVALRVKRFGINKDGSRRCIVHGNKKLYAVCFKQGFIFAFFELGGNNSLCS